MLEFGKGKKLDIVSIVDFLRQNNSNLLDFVGFSGDKSFFSKNVHPEHKNFVEASQGVRQGTLFEGKYMDSKSYFKLAGKVIKLELRNNRA